MWILEDGIRKSSSQNLRPPRGFEEIVLGSSSLQPEAEGKERGCWMWEEQVPFLALSDHLGTIQDGPQMKPNPLPRGNLSLPVSSNHQQMVS